MACEGQPCPQPHSFLFGAALNSLTSLAFDTSKPDRLLRWWIAADHVPFKTHSLSACNWSSCLRSWEVITIPFYSQLCDIRAGPADLE